MHVTGGTLTDTPRRPPRPDEEDLIRFHNGDTLENIPIIRPPAAAPVQRPAWLMLSGIAVVVALVSGLAVVGVLRLLAGGGSPAAARRPAGAPVPETAVAPSPTSGSPAAEVPSLTPSTSPSPSESLAVAAQPQLEQVRVIQAPVTGGDPGTSYCLVYTNSASGSVKEAILLANAPAYQCTDLLPYDPQGGGSFSTEAPSCEVPARAAVLSFAEDSEWAGTVYFTCLTRHTGA
ncbi:hypothetical protein [Streptomyces sp. NPDC020996]|uniref:hypothetical protein n=1 Tax=Streptomyces sp. NPDC020996 TaxID=3154791 RepID=UPI0033F82F5F